MVMLNLFYKRSVSKEALKGSKTYPTWTPVHFRKQDGLIKPIQRKETYHEPSSN